MMRKNKPKISVTLYSYTKELYSGYYDIETCIAKAAEAGAQGVEIVNTQHLPGFPDPTVEYMENFRKLLEKYNLQAACYGSYTDSALRKDGIVTNDELVSILKKDIEYAHIMGFPVIRLGYDTSPEILERVVDEAAQKEIRLGIELHAPITVQHPIYKKFVNLFDKYNSPYLGFVPDFSGWAERLPDVMLNAMVAYGVPLPIVKALGTAFVEDVDIELLKKDFHSKGVPEELDYILDLVYHVVVKGDPESLKMILKRAVHVHGKFWGLNENDDETCIPYEKLLHIVNESGYSGFITSEFEGYEFSTEFDGQDNVMRHIRMMKKYLGTEK